MALQGRKGIERHRTESESLIESVTMASRSGGGMRRTGMIEDEDESTTVEETEIGTEIIGVHGERKCGLDVVHGEK